MDRYTMVVALTGQICGTILLISIIAAVVGRRRGGKTPIAQSDGLHRIEARITEMQQSLDAVAIEVERISEAQRFATKLLSERAPGGIPDNAAREAVHSNRSR